MINLIARVELLNPKVDAVSNFPDLLLAAV
jgi:hypothetical protein